MARLAKASQSSPSKARRSSRRINRSLLAICRRSPSTDAAKVTTRNCRSSTCGALVSVTMPATLLPSPRRKSVAKGRPEPCPVLPVRAAFARKPARSCAMSRCSNGRPTSEPGRRPTSCSKLGLHRTVRPSVVMIATGAPTTLNTVANRPWMDFSCSASCFVRLRSRSRTARSCSAAWRSAADFCSVATILAACADSRPSADAVTSAVASSAKVTPATAIASGPVCRP